MDPLRSRQDRPAPRTSVRALCAGLCAASVLASAGLAAAQPLDADAVASTPKNRSARAGKPAGPNPYLSFLPVEATPDYDAWNQWLAAKGKEKAAAQAPSDPTALIVGGESESNDTQATANFVTGFGSGAGDDPEADLSGTIDGLPAPTIIGPFAEDNGSIPLASSSAPLASGTTVRTSGTIGDGPYGSAGTATGDFDFLILPGLAAGDEIVIDVDTPLPFCCDLDPMVGIRNSAGTLLAFNDDQPMGGTYDSYLAFTVPAAGTYYVSIGAYQSPWPTNPFDSSSGTGVTTEGSYDMTIGVNARDPDYFSFDLEPGDVISATGMGLSNSARVTLFDPAQVERVGGSLDLTGLTPGPFPGGGPNIAYVVETAGMYAVRIIGTGGPYTLQLRVFRPNLEQQLLGTTQTLFVDFDGATVDPSIFGVSPGSAVLSPLSSFLTAWGLTLADENAVIDGILDTLEENLSTDMRVLALNGDYDVSGIPGDFDLVILNSRDHVDPFGDPNVSRLIIGGTIAELGIGTIGISQSIDPGNFSTEDTAVVLLDLLSAPTPDSNTLNQFSLAGGATKVDLVGIGVGNVAAHEAGHFFSSFHTSQTNPLASIMDQGGILANNVGVGVDLTLGTGDDVDVDFEADAYVLNEGFTGTQDTLNATAFGLSTGAADCPPAPLGTCRTAIKSSLLIKDNATDARDSILFKWIKGQATTQPELGDPTLDASYYLCVYDAGGVVRKTSAPAAGLCDGDACWETTGSGPSGLRYRDKERTPSGTSSVILKSGAFPKPKIVWKAKGALLGDDALGLTLPVTVQIYNSETPVCFTQTYASGDVTTNTAQQFKAGTP
jgi:hypothetical protein